MVLIIISNEVAYCQNRIASIVTDPTNATLSDVFISKDNVLLKNLITDSLGYYKIENRQKGTDNFKFHKITRAIPNRETITSFYVDENFLYVGLHIDQSKRFTIHAAHKSGNRISINLGSETRTLIFVNLTLIQVYNLTQCRNGGVRHYPIASKLYHS